MISFNVPPYTGKELDYMREAIQAHKICGDGQFTRRCNEWIEQKTGTAKALLTTSCTHAMEMAALLCGVGPGDEVIMPSFTFVSTANAFVQRGARIVFVDIRPDTMNLDEKLIEAAITDRTRVIAPVHYAGVACEMDRICQVAQAHGLLVMEDAAQGVNAGYKGKALGAIGDFGAFSFHETKNYSMGEGGALLIRDPKHIEAAEILREKGTDRSRFLRGQVDKYTWVAYGSSYLPSDLNAAYLWAQLACADDINARRLSIFDRYHAAFEGIAQAGRVQRPYVPDGCVHNGHMYYLKCADLAERTALIDHLKAAGISAVFHYVPLHSSPAGQRYGRFAGEDRYTTRESERLVRLPFYESLTEADQAQVIDAVLRFYA